MPIATDPSPLKRARVHEQDNLPPSPFEAATLLITSAVRSLLPPIQPIALNFAKQHLSIFRLIEERKRSLAHLQRDDYLPRSVRSSFTLNASKRVSETAAFLTLQQSVQNHLAASQRQLKEFIIAAADLELKALERQLAENFFSLVAYLSKSSVIIAHPGLNECDDYTSTVFLLATQTLRPCSPMNTLSDEEKSLLLLPYSTRELPLALDTTQRTLLQPIASDVAATVTSLCTAPSEKYVEQTLSNSLFLKLHNITTLQSHDTLAADTAMVIDTESSTPPQLLQAYIDKSIKKSLARHLQQLSVKEVRGASDIRPSSGASLKKKQENDQKAAAGRALAAAQRKAENDQKAATGRALAAAQREANTNTKVVAGHPAVAAAPGSDAANKSSKQKQTKKSSQRRKK